MKAISIKQPWASLVAAGYKTVECRTWKTHYRGPLLICSSKGDFEINDGLVAPGGMALGVVELVDVRPMTRKDIPSAYLPSDAEREALDALKIEALKKGADAVYCLRLNLTEATSGNGMLMVSVTGAATSTGRDDSAIQKAIDYLKS